MGGLGKTNASHLNATQNLAPYILSELHFLLLTPKSTTLLSITTMMQ